MLNKKEIIAIIISTIILAFSITLVDTIQNFLYVLLGIFILLMINILTKKVTAFFLESEIEIKLWEFRQWGYRAAQHFKRPFPAGAFFPIISKIILFPFNSFVWMASLVFDVKAKTYRSAKRHGMYSFSEMSEDHIALIAAAGIFANLIFAIIFYLIGLPLFARLNIYFAFFNMIPISNLDGNKIFFGKLVLWNVLAILTLIAMGYSIWLI